MEEKLMNEWGLRAMTSSELQLRGGAEKKLLATIKPETNTPSLAIRQPFTFEFLGLKAKDVITEGDLEDALISHLQDFLLELGKGFCFEARQKRIIIDDEYYYPDLVFYHRIHTPLPAWTTNSSSLPICSNSQTRELLKSSCWMK